VTRVGLIGLGTMGRNHLRLLSEMDGVELAAVCDTDERAVESVTRDHSVAGYGTWDQMLTGERLDAAIVAVPTRFHCPAAVASLEHGLDTFVEKPIASDLAEGRQIVDAAKRAGKLLAVGHVERFNPAVRELQRRVSAGDAGRLYQFHARRQGPFPARIRDVGVVIDLATHDLDVMDHLAASRAVRAYAETEQRIHTEHEDLLNALLKFETGVLGVLQVNWLSPVKIRELSVLGERGLFICNYLSQDLVFVNNADPSARTSAANGPRAVKEGHTVELPVERGEPLRAELEAFIAAVRGERPIEVDGEAGLRALHLALGLIQSATEGRVVDRAGLDRLWTASDAGPPDRHDH
jgi:UDP-N-acetylglucosamine 3-dehydrogenase